VADEARPERRRRIRRGEGEVTEWPRGLTEYVPAGPPDATPSEEEDRLRNRLQLAARLLGVLRANGRDVDASVRALAEAERQRVRGDRVGATRRVDAILAELDRELGPGESV